MDFSETIEACDLKVGRCRQLIEPMKVWKVKVISLPWPQGIYKRKSKLVFLRNYWAILTKFCMYAFRYKKIKKPEHDAGHMTRMAVITLFGKNPSTIFFSRTHGPISMNLGMLASGPP